MIPEKREFQCSLESSRLRVDNADAVAGGDGVAAAQAGCLGLGGA